MLNSGPGYPGLIWEIEVTPRNKKNEKRFSYIYELHATRNALKTESTTDFNRPSGLGCKIQKPKVDSLIGLVDRLLLKGGRLPRWFDSLT
jgi:hypothetical protein